MGRRWSDWNLPRFDSYRIQRSFLAGFLGHHLLARDAGYLLQSPGNFRLWFRVSKPLSARRKVVPSGSLTGQLLLTAAAMQKISWVAERVSQWTSVNEADGIVRRPDRPRSQSPAARSQWRTWPRDRSSKCFATRSASCNNVNSLGFPISAGPVKARTAASIRSST